MNKNTNIYTLSPEREEKLWNNAVFVFDSSALLNFYFISLEARKEIFGLFASELKNRLLIPYHVRIEYEKNIHKSTNAVIKEYNSLLEDNIEGIQKDIRTINNKFENLENKTKKSDKHPFLQQDLINNYKSKFSTLEKEMNAFVQEIKNQTTEKIKEIEGSFERNDDVKKAIADFVETGRDYSFDKIMEITKEGKHRFEFSIPPGYKDVKDKKGFQIFGDLIIWKQIIDFAKEKQKDIIFISDDKKEDWYRQDKTSPREELIKELRDATGVEFWMHSSDVFLCNLNKYFKAKIEKTEIENLSKTIAKKKANKIIFRCDKCKTINLVDKKDVNLGDSDFECVATYDTGESRMGDENQHEAKKYFYCRHCGNEITATFTVWEYPIGCNDSTDVYLDGATLIECFDFEMNFYDEPYDDDYMHDCED